MSYKLYKLYINNLCKHSFEIYGCDPDLLNTLEELYFQPLSLIDKKAFG